MKSRVYQERLAEFERLYFGEHLNKSQIKQRLRIKSDTTFYKRLNQIIARREKNGTADMNPSKHTSYAIAIERLRHLYKQATLKSMDPRTKVKYRYIKTASDIAMRILHMELKRIGILDEFLKQYKELSLAFDSPIL